jgi:aminopeptidase N
VLNAADLIIRKATLSGRTAPLAFTADKKTETIAFRTGPLKPGRYTLTIDYSGKIFTQASGLFALDYDTAATPGAASVKKRALFTQFENSDARRFAPMWDEPGVKSVFSLTVETADDWMAVSNMPAAKTEPLGGGRKAVTFQDSPKMSSYLVFLGLGDFERIHQQVGPTDVGVVVRRGDGAKAQFALDAAVKLLGYYNDYFDEPYPLPKLDMVAGPGRSQFFGAMENWGAIFYFDYELLLDPKISSEADRQNVFVVVAHEMAHQWFGDLVTMAWWDDLWLNEGFASWMENKATDHFHPEWKIWLQTLDGQQGAMRTDARAGTHPVITPIPDVFAAANAFDGITYQKGQAVIRMLEAYAGEDRVPAGRAQLHGPLQVRQHGHRPAVGRGRQGVAQADQRHRPRLHPAGRGAAGQRAPDAGGDRPDPGPVRRRRQPEGAAQLAHAGDRAEHRRAVEGGGQRGEAGDG